MTKLAKRLQASQVDQAGQLLREGGVMIFPTDTLYGIGCSALDGSAVDRVFKIKQRPLDKSLIILIADLDQLEDYVSQIYPTAQVLIDKFWPGPLTLVFPLKKGSLPDQVTAGKETIAIRLPANVLTRRLIRASGSPLVAPSANINQQAAVTNFEVLYQQFAHQLDALLEGPADLGQEAQPSTLVYPQVQDVYLLRQGAIQQEELEAVSGLKLIAKNL